MYLNRKILAENRILEQNNKQNLQIVVGFHLWIIIMSCCQQGYRWLSLSRHFSPSFIASGRSSRLHPLPSHSWCMYVRASRPAFARPYLGFHRSTSLISSSPLLQQNPVCLVRLTWIVFMMGGRWPYSWCLVGCYRQDLLNIARNILPMPTTLMT